MTEAHEEILNFIAAGSTSRSLLEFQPSAATRERVEYLIHKEKTEGLLPEETQELEDFMNLEHLMRMAKAKARALVAGE